MGKCLQRWFRARISEKKPFAQQTEEKEANTERPGCPVLSASRDLETITSTNALSPSGKWEFQQIERWGRALTLVAMVTQFHGEILLALWKKIVSWREGLMYFKGKKMQSSERKLMLLQNKTERDSSVSPGVENERPFLKDGGWFVLTAFTVWTPVLLQLD